MLINRAKYAFLICILVLLASCSNTAVKSSDSGTATLAAGDMVPSQSTVIAGEPKKTTLTIDEVRALAEKGESLSFNDFDNFLGGDASSNLNYHIMLYGVEGGYRLIVRSDGKAIDRADLERIWDSGGSGIDIRNNDVDAFVKTHPSHTAVDTSVEIHAQ